MSPNLTSVNIVDYSRSSVAETLLSTSYAANMRFTVERAMRAAPTSASILITGETGTGKEVMARFIHANSLRHANHLIAVNCAAIPDNLLESELFGHERGSFSGATGQRIGKLELSHKGTLLLDEISEMHQPLQAKLLRALQEREIDRVGGKVPIPVDMRIIAITNRNIAKEVAAGTFREDLYYRLNVVPIHMPSLRDRPDDIIPLADHFIDQIRVEGKRISKQLSDEAKDILSAYDWPGNVRELKNAIERAIILSTGSLIHAVDLEIETRNRDKPIPRESIKTGFGHNLKHRLLEDIEREAIMNTLISTNGNRSKASEILGMSVRSLRNKLKLYMSTGSKISTNIKLDTL